MFVRLRSNFSFIISFHNSYYVFAFRISFLHETVNNQKIFPVYLKTWNAQITDHFALKFKNAETSKKWSYRVSAFPRCYRSPRTKSTNLQFLNFHAFLCDLNKTTNYRKCAFMSQIESDYETKTCLSDLISRNCRANSTLGFGVYFER